MISGPRWFTRPNLVERSWPSTLKIGTKRKFACSSRSPRLPRDGHVAQEHQAGVFPVDLAGMNACLCEHDRFAVFSQRFRRGCAFSRGDDHPEVAAFGRFPEGNHLQLRRCGHELAQPGDGLFIGGVRRKSVFSAGVIQGSSFGGDQFAALAIPWREWRKDRLARRGRERLRVRRWRRRKRRG